MRGKVHGWGRNTIYCVAQSTARGGDVDLDNLKEDILNWVRGIADAKFSIVWAPTRMEEAHLSDSPPTDWSSSESELDRATARHIQCQTKKKKKKNEVSARLHRGESSSTHQQQSQSNTHQAILSHSPRPKMELEDMTEEDVVNGFINDNVFVNSQDTNEMINWIRQHNGDGQLLKFMFETELKVSGPIGISALGISGVNALRLKKWLVESFHE